MTAPAKRRSFRSRLRLAFALVVLGTLLAAALTAVVMVRNANEADARDEATAVARTAARAARAELDRVLGEPSESLAVDVNRLVQQISRDLIPENGELVRVRPGTMLPVSRNAEVPGEFLPFTGTPTALLLESRLVDGEEAVINNGGEVIAATPLPLSDETIDRLQLETDVVAVVVVRDLGTAGLGSTAPGLVATVVVALVIAGLLAELLAHRVRTPLSAVASTSRQLSAGDLEARVDVPRSADREMADIAETVNDLASKLEESQRARQQFLVDVAHELRTPLTSVRGYAELLADADGATGSVAPDIERIGGIIGREATRMERLVEDLLTQARFDAGELHCTAEAVDLAALARESLAALEVSEAAHIINLRGPEPSQSLLVTADPLRTIQVLVNLVHNATDFAASAVQVTVHRDATHGILEVDDDGPGLGGYADRVFERHWRGDPSGDRRGHVGVGLSIVADLVGAMDGTVRALDLSTGSRFEVRLPLA